jgi:hypothetical protein
VQEFAAEKFHGAPSWNVADELCANKFTEAGEITIDVRDKKRTAASTVADTGVGMTPKQKGKLLS